MAGQVLPCEDYVHEEQPLDAAGLAGCEQAQEQFRAPRGRGEVNEGKRHPRQAPLLAQTQILGRWAEAE